MLSVNDPEKGIRWLQERENGPLRSDGIMAEGMCGILQETDIIWTP